MRIHTEKGLCSEAFDSGQQFLVTPPNDGLRSYLALSSIYLAKLSNPITDVPEGCGGANLLSNLLP